MSKPTVSTKRILKLYRKMKCVADVARRVGLHYTTVRCRLIRNGVIEGSIFEGKK